MVEPNEILDSPAAKAKKEKSPKKKSKKERKGDKRTPETSDAEDSNKDPVDSENEDNDSSSTESADVTAAVRDERFRSLSYKGPRSEFNKFLKELKVDLGFVNIVTSVEKVKQMFVAEAELHCNKDGILGSIKWSELQIDKEATYAQICMQFLCAFFDNHMVSTIEQKDDTIEKEQKKSDRIKKNRTAFYPLKLSHACKLGPFLIALKLECNRIPMWDRCLEFSHQTSKTSKTKEKLYTYLKFHNDTSCVTSMESFDFHTANEEASYSLYLSIMASLSDDIIEELELHKDKYKLNGPTLLLKLIQMLSPALQEIRLETSRYFDNILDTMVESKWNILVKAPEIRRKFHERRNAGGSTEDIYGKVTDAFAHCDDDAYKSHHSNFLQNHPNPKANGDTVLEYLFHASKVTKKLINHGTWNCAIPKHHDKSSASKSKKRKGDEDIAAFAASAKKIKQEYEAKIKSRDNTINQLKKQANVSERRSDKKTSGPSKPGKPPKISKQAPTKKQETSSDGRPPKGLYSNVFTSDYYGPKCYCENKQDWMNFITGTSLSDSDKRTATKHGFNIVTKHGEFIWYWCKYCDRMGGHRAFKCKNKDESSGARPAPKAYVASISSEKKDDKQEEEEEEENYSSSDDDDSDFGEDA
ncbi:predicted protein [Chaetoceros tenuissimus]|uniref:Uncharacterized protein n=1 Tax=Chaetoceros tenuissimus TaxID=426638 RepID=A0AAD3CTB2_9STRA|nr:predicted protein [Chaetoceros tenuissimus]